MKKIISLLGLIILVACSSPTYLNQDSGVNESPNELEEIVYPTPSLTSQPSIPPTITLPSIDPPLMTNEPEPIAHNAPTLVDLTNANYIRTLLVDQQGNLWTGGSGGVVRWDSTSGEYTKYTASQGLPRNFVTDITEDADGVLWFSTCLGGITRFDGKHWTTFTTEDGLLSNCVMSLEITTEGIVWAGSVDGINRFDGTFWTAIPVLPSLESIARVEVITEAPNGDLWLGALGDHSLMRFDGEIFIDYSMVLPNPSVLAITFSNDGTMWVGGEDYLMSYQNNIWQTHPSAFTADQNSGVGVSSIAVSDQGTVWVGFTQSADEHSFGSRENMVNVQERFHGVSKLENGIWTTFDQEDGLTQNEVTDIFIDSNENVWFGTYSQGVSKLSKESWQTFIIKDEIPTNSIHNLEVISSNEVWITSPDGLYGFDGERWFVFGNENTHDQKVDQILSTSDGALWIKTIDGLFRYKNESLTEYPVIPASKFSTIYKIFFDDERYWFVTSNGVFLLDGNYWSIPGFLSDLSEIGDLVIDSNGDIWVAAHDGIYVFQDGKLKNQFKVQGSMFVGYNSKLLMDADGSIWVGSSKGISKFDGEQWVNYKKEENSSGSIRDMELDPLGNIWVLMESGLDSFDGLKWIDHQLQQNFYQLEIDENGTVWLASETLLIYVK